MAKLYQKELKELEGANDRFIATVKTVEPSWLLYQDGSGRL